MLCNDPKDFREEMLAGYEAAYPEYIRRVPGGVVRADATDPAKVAVINGGGSGHFPAFCGIVGEGFMDGTVVGNIFTSPSTEDVLSVARAVGGDAGLYIVGGNYAGDKINFNLARDELRREGADCRTFYITDDIASAGQGNEHLRRGNVGTFTVFKTAGAAAAAGYSLAEVDRVTRKANAYTRTMSVGFKGCTLPGADSPMFAVPEGRMEMGQGIHGEPGVYEADLLPARQLGDTLIDHIMADVLEFERVPDLSAKRLAVILDGLGSTKYEELFVVWGSVRKRLEQLGFTLVEPLVGELVTSLDMAGLALSVTFLDDELERLWRAPAETPAFRRGDTDPTRVRARREIRTETPEEPAAAPAAPASESSKEAACFAAAAFARVAAKMAEEEENLARIDAAAGDGDHGRGMVKGTSAAAEAAAAAARAGAGLGDVLTAAGAAWAAKAGGTSGVLWGEALQAAGRVLGNTDADINNRDAARAVRAAADRMQALGGAKKGDKTMLDALLPFVEDLEKASHSRTPVAEVWARAAAVAEEAAAATKDLLPKVGRARPQAERSLGTPDAGATSLAMCLKAVLPGDDAAAGETP